MSNPLQTRWEQLLFEAEERQNWRCLSADQIELLRIAYRAGVEAKADEVQPMIAKIELRARRSASLKAHHTLAGSN